MIKTIFHFLKPYKGLSVLTILTTLLDVSGALLIPTITADMINNGVNQGNMSYIIKQGIFMAVITLIVGVGTIWGSHLCAGLSSKLGMDMRNAIYDKTLTFSDYDFDRYGTGSMITRTLNDVNVIQQGVVWMIQYVIPVPLLCVMGICLAFSIDVTMGVILLASTATVILLAVFVTRKAAEIFEKLQRFLDRMNVVLRENLTGVRVIRAFNKERHEEKRMRKSFEDYAEASIKANKLFAGLESMSFFLVNVSVVVILWVGGNRVGTGFMEIGDITAVMEYAMMILFYIVMAQMVIILIPRARVCTERLRAVLEHEPSIWDEQSVKRISMTGEDREKKEILSFRNVSFRFEDAEEEMLQNLTFTCRRGETTAIIGGTGSGKSTIAKLILRFHDVTKGAICFAGSDIRKISQEELRSRISYVPQKAWLFSGTIADNLRQGKEDATEKEMKQALLTAQSEFVFSLQDGLNSHVAQGGTNFSGGQKQRLSIARALMKQADLYIFDDSFSALDFKTDAALRKALQSRMQDAAMLIVAQRVNTIMHAQQIIVLDEGKIAGIGTHESLLQTCPVYQKITHSQMKGDEDDE